MISYLMVGTNDLPRAVQYFGTLMELMGASKVYEAERSAGWGWGVGTPMFIVGMPHDGKPATVGNGSMISFDVGSKEKVDSLYAKALDLGGASEGAPVKGRQGRGAKRCMRPISATSTATSSTSFATYDDRARQFHLRERRDERACTAAYAMKEPIK
jgi:hypothetical protein